MPHAAVNPANQRVRSTDGQIDDSALHHQLAGQHEKGNGEEREGIDGEHHFRGQHLDRELRQVEARQACGPEGEGQRDAQDAGKEEDDGDDETHFITRIRRCVPCARHG